jgi:hypothetical protein
MMGRQAGDQSQLFYLFNLEERIPARHLLRRINPIATRVLVRAAVTLQRDPNCVIRPLGVSERAPPFWRQASDPGRHECV